MGHEVVGILKGSVFHEMDAITDDISNSCEPAIIPDVYVQAVDEKPIIVVEIGAGRQRPYYLKSKGPTEGVYVRVAGREEYSVSKDQFLPSGSRISIR